MKGHFIPLLLKTKTFILAHKIITIIAVVVISASAAVTTGAMILSNEPSSEEITTEETTTQETTIVETTTQATTAETTTAETSTTKVTLIPVEKIKVAKKDTSTKAEVMGASESVESTPQNTGAIYEISDIAYGIDVSKYQGNIDWAKVKASGIKFAIIKVGGRYGGDGTLYQDPYFTKNIENALANGIQVGVYFFSQALNEQEALEEASLTVSYLKSYHITYPVCFDWETSSSLPRTYTAGLSKDAMTSIASTFCEAVKSAGYTPMVYASKNDWYNRYNATTLTSKYKAWLANYFYSYQDSRKWYQLGESLPNYKYSYQMWQYSSNGLVDGINGSVDLNLGFFSYSGTSVSTTSLKLAVTNTNVTTNVGTPVNLLSGVTASNTVGADVSSSVSVTVKDSSGNTIDQASAFNTPGSYVLTYKIVDFTGGSKSANANLIVRAKPTITGIQPSYTVEAGTSYDAIIANLRSGVTAVNSEGQSITDSLVITGITQDTLTAGTYTIHYSVIDATGLSSNTYTTTLVITEPATT